ncbi:DUF952 domain-containing protein [uncultured Maritalea sp.]|jgi:uncharacterized protein (DUF952 family)|uniref:DUF952 domain-containing protein n=1 Tax=uncultured Maritalea sp. TaxID=757249 RepID=UPI002616F62A|nr:DUF952 domain-containing protein [uncultured Maritalea sp.]
MRIFKVCTVAHWSNAKANGVFSGVAVDLVDGFIHFSTAEQLAETLQKHFTGQSDLVLLSVDPEKIGTELKWEPSRGGALFPHLYADLPLVAIVAEHMLETDAQGVFILPEGLFQ